MSLDIDLDDDIESRIARIISVARAGEYTPRATAQLIISTLARHGFLIRLVVPDEDIPY